MKKFVLTGLALCLTIAFAAVAWGHGPGHGWRGNNGHNYDHAEYTYDGGDRHGGPCWNNGQGGWNGPMHGYNQQQRQYQDNSAQPSPYQQQRQNQQDWTGPRQ